jgi:hypothetical protein
MPYFTKVGAMTHLGFDIARFQQGRLETREHFRRGDRRAPRHRLGGNQETWRWTRLPALHSTPRRVCGRPARCDSHDTIRGSWQPEFFQLEVEVEDVKRWSSISFSKGLNMYIYLIVFLNRISSIVYGHAHHV